MKFADKISAYNRERKWRLFCRVFAPQPETKILDAGFNAVEYSAVDNYLEKKYPYPKNITALGLSDPAAFESKYPSVKAVRYGGGRFPFSDKEFDIGWSNAVLEHVGGEDKQIEFIRELTRVSKRIFLTTPNRLFPVEVHTRLPLLHWLPKPWFEFFLRVVGKEWAGGDYMRLLSKKDLRRLLIAAGVKNFRIYHNRLLGLTLDFAVVTD